MPPESHYPEERAEKLRNFDHERGTGCICSGRGYNLPFDTVQQSMLAENRTPEPVPSILYPQLLGLSMGFSAGEMDIDRHLLDAGDIERLRKTAASA